MRIPTQELAKCIARASPRDVTLAGVAANILLSGLKAGVGCMINSASLIAERFAVGWTGTLRRKPA